MASSVSIKTLVGPRTLTLTILVMLVCSIPTHGAEVYWDISHGVSDNYKPSGRYSVLVDHLNPLGFNFTESAAPLSGVDLDSYDVLVIANGSVASSSFTPGELSQIDAFVRNGGGLLLMSDVGGSSGTAKIQQVADLFNASVGLSMFPSSDIYSTSIGNHPSVQGVNQVYLRFSSTINPGTLTPYAWRDSLPMLAAGNVDGGRVVLIADGDLFTFPPSGPHYYDLADNRILSESTFAWLAVPEPTIFMLMGCITPATILYRKRC